MLFLADSEGDWVLGQRFEVGSTDLGKERSPVVRDPLEDWFITSKAGSRIPGACYPNRDCLLHQTSACQVAVGRLVLLDDGVVLSVVLDGIRRKSALLVLNAKSMEETARTEVPHYIPFGFHGHFKG